MFRFIIALIAKSISRNYRKKAMAKAIRKRRKHNAQKAENARKAMNNLMRDDENNQ